MSTADAIRAIQATHGIVGREDELALALAVLESGRHLLLEGPVGVGKTTIALAVCEHLGRATVRVDGDDRYSEAKLTGWFDPPLVLQTGFGEASFTAGPLVEAMRTGSVLFINELNRMPETVQNVLLPALDERRIGVPHLGEVRAQPGFMVVATQNPVEYVATGHLSEALRDRFEHIPLAYQSAREEAGIVAAEAGATLPEGETLNRALLTAAVTLARASREHPRVRKGSSIRGAIATVEIGARLGVVVGESPVQLLLEGTVAGLDRAAFRRAAAAALRTRIELRDDAGAGFDTILGELVEQALAAADAEVRAPPSGNRSDKRDPYGDLTPDADAAGEGEDGDIPLVAVRAKRPTAADIVNKDGSQSDGWQLAARLTSGRLPNLDDDALEEVERLATAEVLRRASALVGPLRGRTRVKRGPQVDGHTGELDVATTLDNVAGKPFPEAHDWIVERRQEERRQVVLMIDTSRSMAGEPMALAAVAAAVLAFKVRAGDLGIVVFADDARDVLVLGEQPGPAEIIRRLLDRPCGGSTNISAALEAGERQLSRSGDPRRMAVLVTDGQFTVGGDPRPIAERYTALHVLQTSAAKGRSAAWINPIREAGPDLARVGGGSLVPVASFDELPRRMLDLAEAVLR